MTASNKPSEPTELDALLALARRAQAAGRPTEAEAVYRKILTLQPSAAWVYNNLGNLLMAQGKLDEAAAHYERALALNPGLVQLYNNLGCILSEQGKPDESQRRFEQALALKPDYAEAHNNFGNMLQEQGQLDQAAARYEQAIALRPDYAEAHNNLGNVHLSQGKLDEAAAQYMQALALKPAYAEAHNNLGNVLRVRGSLDDAATHYTQAIALWPDYADAQMGLAACDLIKEDYQRGWPAYEARLRLPSRMLQPSFPRWRGESLSGRRLLLLAEQGLGDTLQFVRYARLLKERGARVVLAAPPALGLLLAGHPDLDELFLLGSGGFPECDFYLPLLSAPGALGTTATTIPREVPYIWADAGLTQKWRQELAAIDGFKIAIAWQGSRDYRLDRWRSIPLAAFAPLAALPGVRLISLQKGPGSEQIATVDFPILDLSGRLDEAAGPFMDTAAVIRSVDLVVTSDTAIPHLAGALGVPVWMATPFSPDWRWLLGREDSPWYPTMRLFRQTTFGEWSDVLQRIAQAVDARRA